jgi:hypothetical protein
MNFLNPLIFQDARHKIVTAPLTIILGYTEDVVEGVFALQDRRFVEDGL